MGRSAKSFMPNIIMMDFADPDRCATICNLNLTTDDMMARMGNDLTNVGSILGGKGRQGACTRKVFRPGRDAGAAQVRRDGAHRDGNGMVVVGNRRHGGADSPAGARRGASSLVVSPRAKALPPANDRAGPTETLMS